MNITNLPPSINFHVWQPCNMRCRHCFATFHDIPREQWLTKGEAIALAGLLSRNCEKITFSGGEPTLCPWLPDMIREAKRHGVTTMLVTNGSRLTEEYLRPLAGLLDWVGVSIDSVTPITLQQLGRTVGKEVLTADYWTGAAVLLRNLGMDLKVNTVVNALNVDEDLTPFIQTLRPNRWKILQALSIDGQNTGMVEPLLVDKECFHRFVRRHEHLRATGIDIACEDQDAIRGSYAMVDPSGRFFDDTRGGHTYSAPILKVGFTQAAVAFGLPARGPFTANLDSGVASTDAHAAVRDQAFDFDPEGQFRRLRVGGLRLAGCLRSRGGLDGRRLVRHLLVLSVTRCTSMPYMTHEAMIFREHQGNSARFRMPHAAHSFGVTTTAKDSFAREKRP